MYNKSTVLTAQQTLTASYTAVPDAEGASNNVKLWSTADWQFDAGNSVASDSTAVDIPALYVLELDPAPLGSVFVKGTGTLNVIRS